MPGIVIRIIDTRVGRSFKNPTQFDFACGAETRMNDLFAEIKKKCGARKIGSLQILSHAIYEPESTIKSPENKEGIIERFGFGVSFCSEGINEGTAGNFSAFRGMFASARGIFLQGCGVAATSTALKGVGHLHFVKVGDGAALCQKIADAAGTGVVASSDPQPGPCDVETRTYKVRSGYDVKIIEETGPPMNCEAGPWNGNVWLFSPKAKAPTKIQ
ncbi:MAG TPA: hypothetical protein VE914_01225 [Candidatus Angelobacter sp.]|nr:hypothetical protein [Candidatus Angelobacter sp.]